MKTIITNQIEKLAIEKALTMPIGTFSRLAVNNEITDLVVRPMASGVTIYEAKIINADIFSAPCIHIAY